MSEQRPFFKGDEESFGIFYPTNYLIAAFESNESARRAKDILCSNGYTDDEVQCIPAQDVQNDIEREIQDASRFKRIKQKFSKLVGTEGRYWENDLALARQGAGFLAVYCPKEKDGRRVLELLKSENPKSMRRYAALAIEELVEPPASLATPSDT